MAIRELSKSPELILIEQPEDFIRHDTFIHFSEIISDLADAKIPVVFFTYREDFLVSRINKKVVIERGIVGVKQ